VNGPRISLDHLAAAVKKVEAMTLAEKSALIDEVHQEQPNLLASCLVQPRLGVTLEKLEFLLHVLMVCFQAMKESTRHWPVISEDLQEQQLERLVGSILFSEDIAHPLIANQARAQGEFQWSLQHLDTGGVAWDEHKAGSLSRQDGNRCTRPAGPALISGRISKRSGRALPQDRRVKKRHCRVACRSHWVLDGFARRVGLHRSA
jgi:hypothetical protein